MRRRFAIASLCSLHHVPETDAAASLSTPERSVQTVTVGVGAESLMIHLPPQIMFQTEYSHFGLAFHDLSSQCVLCLKADDQNHIIWVGYIVPQMMQHPSAFTHSEAEMSPSDLHLIQFLGVLLAAGNSRLKSNGSSRLLYSKQDFFIKAFRMQLEDFRDFQRQGLSTYTGISGIFLSLSKR